MTTAQATENRIVQNLLHGSPARGRSPTPGADRLIRLIAVTAALFLVGSYLQELLWVALAAATTVALGFKR